MSEEKKEEEVSKDTSKKSHKKEKSNRKVVEVKSLWCEMLKQDIFTKEPLKKEKLDIVILLPHYQHIFYNFDQKAYYIPLSYGMYLKLWKARDNTLCYYIDSYDVFDTNKVLSIFNSFLPYYDYGNKIFSLNGVDFKLGDTLADSALFVIIYFEHLEYEFSHILYALYEEQEKLDKEIKILTS